MNRFRIPLLWICLLLFIGRVVGQLLVASDLAPWLPPMKEWQSGLLPYPLLVFFQIVIILVYSNAALAVTRKRGYFYDMQSRFSKRLTNFAIVYAGSMVLRYFLYMYLVPEARWLHGTIPIVFHLVLATFLLAYADISTKETNHTPIIVDDELAVREEVLPQ